MKYFMGFLLCLSLLVNFIYMAKSKEYSIIVEDVWRSPSGNDFVKNTYKIKFFSYTEPITENPQSDTAKSFYADFVFMGMTDSTHQWVVSYK